MSALAGIVGAVEAERTCYRCDGVFPTASADRRVYCPLCRVAYGFPAPSLPVPARVVASESPRTGPAADPVTAKVPGRPRCGVCGQRVRSGQTTCDAASCGEQGALFSATPDRRRREWRRDA